MEEHDKTSHLEDTSAGLRQLREQREDRFVKARESVDKRRSRDQSSPSTPGGSDLGDNDTPGANLRCAATGGALWHIP